jgi:hypothetical protein
MSHVSDHNKKGGPSTAGASAASACSITIGSLGHTLEHKDGYACGLAVTTWWSDGHKEYAEFGPDGKEHGRYFDRLAHGASSYCVKECGERKDYAYMLSPHTPR